MPEIKGFSRGSGPSVSINDAAPIEFDGNGIVVKYSFDRKRLSDGYEEQAVSPYVAVVEAYLDGKLCETINLPVRGQDRKQELFYKYNLPMGHHTLTFKWLNPEKGQNLYLGSHVVYTDHLDKVIYE